jgi:hypothetical protein
MQDKKSLYKKWWVWIICIIVLFIIVGSFGKSEPKKISTGEQNTQKTEVDTTPLKKSFVVGDKVQLGDYVLTVNDISPCPSSNQFDVPKPGYKFVAADITQENSGAEAKSYNVLDFKLQDDKDFTYTLGFSMCKQPSFGSGTLQQNQKTRGYITFEIPKDNNPTSIIFTPSWLSSDQIIIRTK